MRAFVHPVQCHALDAFGPLLVENGWEVLAARQPAPSTRRWPDWAACVAEDLRPSDSLKERLASVDLVVLYLPGNEAAASSILHILSQVPASKLALQVVIGVTGPLSWGATRLSDLIPDSQSTKQDDELEPISDQHLPRRQGAYQARKAAAVENAILHMGSKSRKAYIVCAGLLYGAGESDSGFAALFKTAWRGSEPVPLYGDGHNLLPVLHVEELASYILTIANAQPAQQYFLIAEREAVKQADIAAAVAQALSTLGTRVVPKKDVLLLDGINHLLLDLPIATTALPAGFQHKRHTPFLAAVKETAAEFLSCRHLTPVRLLVTGAPMAGKTVLARQLAQQYGLQYLDAKAILAAAAEADAEVQKAVKAEQATKDARLSDRTMALLLIHCTSRLAQQNIGWVIDGWPKTLNQAKIAFSGIIEEAAPAKAAPVPAQEASKGKAAAAKGSQKPPPPPTITPSAPAAAVVVARLSTTAEYPTHLIKVTAPEDTLRHRMETIAEEELQAAKLNTPTIPVPPAAKGAKAKDAAPVMLSHNNPKDFQRRLDTYNQLQEFDVEDLKAKVEKAHHDWEKEQQQKAAALAQALANQTARERARQQMSPGTTTSASNDNQQSSKAQGPVIPQHGGLVGLFAAAGTQLVEVRNLDDPSMQEQARTKLAPSATTPPVVYHTPLTLEAAKAAIGPPNNLDGFPPIPSSAATPHGNAGVPGLVTRDVAWRDPEAEARFTAAEQAEMASWSQRCARLTAMEVEPLKEHLMRSVMPAVVHAMMEVARCKPVDPVEVLADFLDCAAVEAEGRFEDPYQSRIYAEREEKHAAKAAREAARSARAAAAPPV